MFDAVDHSQHVDTWMGRAGKDLSQEQLLKCFQQAMTALWNRAHLTLGVVTLTAIMDRVLYNASERFPPFGSLKVEAHGIDCQELLKRGEVYDDRKLRGGIRFVVLEFLVVIGNLTGELLTPSLHSELSKVVAMNAPLRGKRAEGKS